MTTPSSEFHPLNICVLTISDTRTAANDSSGDALFTALSEAGHKLFARDIILDDVYLMRAKVSEWIAHPEVQVIITTGGTGFTGRDSTPEAITPLLDKPIVGFGELFRQISVSDVGSSTIQSRAFAGLANRTLLFCLPGSTNACHTAWDKILREQLDSRTRPCNFYGQVAPKC